MELDTARPEVASDLPVGLTLMAITCSGVCCPVQTRTSSLHSITPPAASLSSCWQSRQTLRR